ncbi:MAG: hypothetical protein IKP72_11380 [Clostridia bacterium]|nr:hypothetical protein [Clostridia bacterium]
MWSNRIKADSDSLAAKNVLLRRGSKITRPANFPTVSLCHKSSRMTIKKRHNAKLYGRSLLPFSVFALYFTIFVYFYPLLVFFCFN